MFHDFYEMSSRGKPMETKFIVVLFRVGKGCGQENRRVTAQGEQMV